MMHKLTNHSLLLLCCIAALLVQARLGAAPAGADAFPVTVTDALHHKVTLKQRPARIISLAPSVTENLFTIGAGARVVADTIYCKYPQKALTLPKVGGYTDPDTEKVLSLKPDLVIAAYGTRSDIIDHMRTMGLSVLTVDDMNLDGIDASLKLIGRMVGCSAAANRVVARLDARRAAVQKQTAHLSAAQRPGVLFLFSFDDLYTAGSGSYIDQMIQVAGGQNIAAATRLPWPQLSMETVVAANPQVILVLAGRMEGGKKFPLTAPRALATLRGKSAWRGIAAVKNGRVVVLHDDDVTLPGPRLLNGLEAIARAVHPELFPGGGGR